MGPDGFAATGVTMCGSMRVPLPVTVREVRVVRRSVMLLVAVLVAGCGGAGGAPTVRPSGGAGGSSVGPGTPAASDVPSLGGSGGSAAGGPTRRIRIVSLYEIGGQGKSVGLYRGSRPAAGAPPLATVEFGKVSPYVDLPVNAEYVLIPDGDLGDPNGVAAGLYRSEAQQASVVLTGSASQGSFKAYEAYTVIEKGPTSGNDSFPSASPGQAIVRIDPAALQAFPAGTADSFYYGPPDAGCLHQRDGTEERFGFGGNVPSDFLAPSPSFQLVAKKGGCADKAAFGPVTVDASTGRVLVFPYGTSPDKITMFVLPVPPAE